LHSDIFSTESVCKMMKASALVFTALLGYSSGFAPTAFAPRVAVAPLRMAAEENTAKPVKVGVIGCGRIGLVHLAAITKAPGVNPVIVSNPTVSKAEKGAIAVIQLLVAMKWNRNTSAKLITHTPRLCYPFHSGKGFWRPPFLK
jgi:hypothetical protein